MKIEEHWPEGLLLFVSALKVGLNLEEALEILMKESPRPLRKELERLMGKDGVWIPTPQKIERLFQAPFLSLVRAALLLNYKTGGRAIQSLETSVSILRRKKELVDKMNMLTVQARWSAWIVGLTPIALIVALLLFSPDFIKPLFSTRLGFMLLGLVCLLNSAGLFIIRRLSRLDP